MNWRIQVIAEATTRLFCDKDMQKCRLEVSQRQEEFLHFVLKCTVESWLFFYVGYD